MKSMHAFAALALLAGISVTPQAFAQAFIQVPAQGTLQQAINNVSDGGIIEIANGSYTPPAGGFLANNLGKGFTIRAATGATVALNGGGTTPIFININANPAPGKLITFERLTFRNGRSSAGDRGGAVTLLQSRANFTNCVFESNTAAPASDGGGGAISIGASDVTLVGNSFVLNRALEPGGGGAIRATNSRLLLIDSGFNNNDAWQSGGALVLFQNRTHIHNSSFDDNRVNSPNHFVNSLGGAISVSDGPLRITNSRFSGNQSGYSGGGIYAFGGWNVPGGMDLVVANSTFTNNTVRRDATRPGFNSPVGGAIQVEDNATLHAYGSRFINNSAEVGGAIAGYRTIIDVKDSAFHGNFTTGTHPESNFGGAIASSSQDTDSADGTINRRNTAITIRNSFFEGRFGAVGVASRSGACLLVAGDPARAYGTGGNTQVGTIAENRATLEIYNSVFNECDVQENGGGGYGGAIHTSLTATTIRDSLFIGNDALPGAANTGVGGAMMIFDNSTADILRTTFIKNGAGLVGGAISAQASDLRVDNSRFAENRLIGPSFWGGAVIFTGGQALGAPVIAANATGLVRNSVFSNNTGSVALFEHDNSTQPYNLMQYSNNSFFPNDNNIYNNTMSAGQRTVAQLNALSLHNQPKAPVANIALGSAPLVAALVPAPSKTLQTYAPGDPPAPTAAYASYGWSGGSATLNGAPVSGNYGKLSVGPATHVLQVGAAQATGTVTLGALPSLSLVAQPKKIGPNQSSLLSWALLGGTYLETFIDNAVNLAQPAPSSGSVTTQPGNRSVDYRAVLVSEEGGVVARAPVTYIADLIFADGLD
jgi:predicted outer membrane repeat protein